jgi:4-carboxymuconolactone decarboxylase
MSRLTPFVLMMGFAVALAGPSRAQDERTKAAPTAQAEGDADKTVLTLSKDKWGWMSERKIDALEALFHTEAVFVHMGGAMSRKQELDVIKSGSIQYKKAEIQEASVRVIGSTAIVLNKIRLLAVVGGNEVTNPFMVTEVYVQQDGKWMLAQLSFTRLLGS